MYLLPLDRVDVENNRELGPLFSPDQGIDTKVGPQAMHRGIVLSTAVYLPDLYFGCTVISARRSMVLSCLDIPRR